MNEFNYKHFHEILMGKKIDFVAIILSKWHLIGLESFLFQQYIKNKSKIKGIILIEKHPKNGFLINENDFFCNKYMDITVFYFDGSYRFNEILNGLKNCLLNKKNNKSDITFISIKEPLISFALLKNRNITKKYNPKFLVTEEGIGSYISLKTWLSVANNELNRSIILSIYATVYWWIYELFIKKLLFRTFNITKFFIFKKKTKLVPNKTVVNSFKKILSLRRKSININTKNGVLILTQPLSEYNYISTENEIDIINTIIKILDTNGMDVIIKTHPREDLYKYKKLNGKYHLITDNYLVEEIIDSLNPKFAIGYTSTALINLNIFFGIKSFSLRNLEVSKYKDQQRKHKPSEFEKLSTDYITFLDDVEDLNEIVEKY